MRLIAIALLVAFCASPRDLDVGVPPGTPLEWDKDLRQPVPTGGRSKVPTTDKKPVSPAASNAAAAKGQTVAEERVPKPPNFDYGVTNLYNFFRVTTKDIATHVVINLPKSTGKVTAEEDGGVATGPGGGGAQKISITWNYPPEPPTELVWMAAMACIREQTHPEVVSVPESVIYCVELGVPALYGCKGGGGKVAMMAQRHLTAIPAAPPSIPQGKTPYQSMMNRLAVVELTSGYAYAMDPTFAKRTLGLGEDSYESVRDCAKANHSFLAQNAAAVLANFRNPDCVAELKRIVENSPDLVMKVRAASGLLRRRETAIVPTFIKWAAGPDEVMRSYALYALGVLGDPRGASIARQIVQVAGSKDRDASWAALPALARMRDGSKETLAVLKALETELKTTIKGDDKVKQDPANGAMSPTPTAEEAGSKLKILRQMALLALAANGDAEAKKEAFARDMSGFHQACWFLVVDVFVKLGTEGQDKVRGFVDSADEVVRLHALRQLCMETKVDVAFLKGKASGSGVMKALALQMLADRDEAAAAELCRQAVAGYASGSGDCDGAEAFAVATAAQVGGRCGAWADASASVVSDLCKAVERAFAAGAFGRREGNNDPDITKAEVKIYPPLLETVCVELGRTHHAAGIASLLKVIDGAKAQGRAEAVLGLGGIGGKAAIDRLIKLLDDGDGWVRYCAYLGVKRWSGQDYFTDWIFGAEGGRKAYVDKFKLWFEQNPAK